MDIILENPFSKRSQSNFLDSLTHSLPITRLISSAVNMSHQELIAFTCASGKQVSHIAPGLYQDAKYKLRLAVNTESSRQRLQHKYPKAEVIQVNLGNSDDCQRFVQGASAVYYVSPPFHPHETQFCMNVIDAAVEEAKEPGSKFAHFVLSSVLHPELRKLMNHDCKRYMEEYLYESSLPYTILQAGHFSDNAIGSLLAERDSPNPMFYVLHPPEIKYTFSCLRDHGEASVKVLRERSKHYYATYQLTSTQPITYVDYVNQIGDVLGKKFEIKLMPFDEAVELLVQHIFGPGKSKELRYRESAERMFLYYVTRGVMASPNVSEWLLARPGTSPAQLAQIMLDAETTK